MNPRSFVILGAFTAVALVAAAVATVIESRVGADVQLYDEPMFPRLVARANDAARITYRTATDSADIVLKDGVWGYTAKQNYPVNAGNIRSAVAAVAALRRLEPKTDDPARYQSLAVEDITPEARGREVTIYATDGELLASVIIGRSSSTMSFDPLGGTYLRVPGERRSWLARGNVALPPSALDWMERQIVHVPGPDISHLQIYEGGQLVLNTEKITDDSGVQRYVLTPADDKLQAVDSAVKQVASAIVSLNFEDVLPGNAIKFPENPRRMVFKTFDGMTLQVDQVEQDGKLWVRFNTSAAPNAAGAERARQIAAATQGWVFQMPGYKLQAFNRPLAELTEPKGTQPGAIPGLGGNQLPAGAIPGTGRVLPPGAIVPGLGAQPLPGIQQRPQP